MAWTWIDRQIILAVHDEQISEHGGQTGIRDEGLLASALARPIDKANYQSPDIAELAAAYGYGLARNHPFLDGNKRTAFVAIELFLHLNGYELNADDLSCFETIMSLADGTLSEEELTAWVRANMAAMDD